MSSASSSRQSARFTHLKDLGWMLKILVIGNGLLAIASATIPEASPQPKLSYRQPLEQIKLAQPCIAQDLSLNPSHSSLGRNMQLIDPAAYYGCNSNLAVTVHH